MSAERRTKWLLAGLGLLLAIFLWQRIVPHFFFAKVEVVTEKRGPSTVDQMLADDGSSASAGAPRRRSPRGRSPKGRRRGAVEATGDPRFVALQLDKLNPTTASYEGGRNPFAFYLPPPPPPPPPPGPTAEELEALRRAQEAEAARLAALAQQRASQPVVPQPPPIPYTYLGRFGPSSRPIAVLTLGEEIHNVLLGDILDGKFRLVTIGLESVELEYVDFPDVPAARLPVGTEGT